MRFGYAEIRSKAAPVSLSNAFWLIGNHFEIDIFEMIGSGDLEINFYADGNLVGLITQSEAGNK